jgi:hypothetical protein
MNTPPVRVGDFVQVRREAVDEPIESAEGTVAELADDGSSIGLGSRVYTAEDGWTWELIRSSVPLPERLSEILAQTFAALEPVLLQGKGEKWRDEAGNLVPVETIRWYEEA